MHSTHANAAVESEPNMPRKGEFYLLDVAYGGPPRAVTFENEQELIQDGRAILRPVVGGFPPLKEKPRLRQRRTNIIPRDYDSSYSGYFLVSEALKSVFEAVDPEAFEFRECEFILVDGSVGPNYYLCDLIREIDAVDEVASDVKIIVGRYRNGRVYDLAARSRIAFKKEVVGQSHVFRTPYSSQEFCDRKMRDALRDAGFGKGGAGGGVMLTDAAEF